MDFSKFKKVSSNNNATKLLHPAGHTIEVAHAALSPKMRKQLDSLPKHMAYGGDSEDDDIEDTTASSPVGQYGFSTPAEAAAQAAAVTSAPTFELGRGTTPLIPSPPAEGKPGGSGGSGIKNPPPPLPDSAAQSTQTTQSASNPMADYQKQYEAGMGLYQKGLQTQMHAEQQLARQQEEVNRQRLEDLQRFNAYHENALNALNQERDNLTKDYVNGHIDPERYISNMSTGRRITTALSLILGGMGAGITGGENPALKMLNAQIDRDIEAQKENLGKQKTLLSLNNEKFGDLRQAEAFTKANLYDMYSTKLQMEAAKANNPMAQARLQQASAQLKMQAAPMYQQIAQQRAIQQTMSDPNLSPVTQIAIKVPKQFQGKAIEEYQNVKAIQEKAHEIAEIAKQAKKETTWKGRPWRGFTPESVNRLQIHMMGALKLLVNRVSDAEIKKMEESVFEVFDSPYKSEEKLETWMTLFDSMKKAPILDNYKIPYKTVFGDSQDIPNYGAH